MAKPSLGEGTLGAEVDSILEARLSSSSSFIFLSSDSFILVFNILSNTWEAAERKMVWQGISPSSQAKVKSGVSIL